MENDPKPLVRPFVLRRNPLQRGPIFRGLPEHVRRFLDQAAARHVQEISPWRLDLLFYGHQYALVRLPASQASAIEQLVQLVVRDPGRAPVARWSGDRRATDLEDEAIDAVSAADTSWRSLSAIGRELRSRADELAAHVAQDLERILTAAAADGGRLIASRALTWSQSDEDLDRAEALATIALCGHRLRLRCEISPRTPEPRWVVELVEVPLDPFTAGDPLAVIGKVGRSRGLD